MRVEFLINGKKASLDVGPLKSMIDVLRDDLCLTGTKKGSLPGEWGAELVFLNGEVVDSSLIPAFRMDGAEILTIEGIKQRKDFPDYERIVKEVLKGNENLFCTANIVVAVKSLFMEKKANDPVSVKEILSGIICSEVAFLEVIDGIKNLSLQKVKGKRTRG